MEEEKLGNFCLKRYMLRLAYVSDVSLGDLIFRRHWQEIHLLSNESTIAQKGLLHSPEKSFNSYTEVLLVHQG